MGARTASSRLYPAGAMVILAAALAGCAATSSGAASTGASGSAASTPASALAAVRLASKTTSGASSFTGTMDLQATAKNGSASEDVSMTATMAEQLRPSLLVQARIGTLSAAGATLPGGLDEIITASAIYMKWSYLTQELHLAKPWLAIPLSTVSKGTGINLSQLFSQATTSSPLNESQMLAGASNVRKVGTAIVGGTSVTEYTGTLSLDKGISYLSGSVKAQVQKEITAAGLTGGTFTVWVDGQSVMRKAVIRETGADLDETITVTINTLNQPVNINVPAASQTSPLPGSALSALSS